MTDPKELVERLRAEAQQESEACKMLADAKTARQTDRDDAWTPAGYDWIKPDQTTRWRAADAITTLLEEVGRYREALRLHVVYENTPADRGGKTGPKGRAWSTFIAARDAALQGSVDRLNDERMPLSPPPVEEN